jgi:hypothetical protein
MVSTRRTVFALGFVLAGLCASTWAADAVPPPPLLPPSAFVPVAAAPAASAAGRKAPRVPPHVRVIEDDNVRIEEAKVHGQTQRVTVHLKDSAGKDYEIIVPPGGKDLSQDRGTTGQRAWLLFSF